MLKLVLFMISASAIEAAEKKGKSNIQMKFKETGQCEDQGNGVLVFNGLKLTQEGQNKPVIIMNITANQPLTDDMDVGLDLSLLGNGGWKKNFFTYEGKNFCKSLHEIFPESFPDFLRSLGTTQCPLPPGEYTDKRFAVDNIRTGMDFPPGTYKVDIYLVSGEVRIGCFMVVVEIKRKKPSKG